MTTTLADREGFIDFAAYGLTEEALRSLKALADIWHDTMQPVAGRLFVGSPEADEFVLVSSALPSGIADIAWQKRWMRAWQRLYAHGFSQSEIFHFFFCTLDACEAEVLGDLQQVGRIHLDLFAILRRSVVAALGCAVEIGEELRNAESGVPGELAALRCLHEKGEAAEVAVLSLSLANRDSFAHLPTSDLQSLPASIAGRLQALLHPEDKVFVGREGEWLLILTGVHSMAQPSLAAAHIQRAFADPVKLLSGRTLMLDVAIGAALMPEHGRDADDILHAARLARWSLAASGQAFGWYHPGLRQDWQQRFDMAEELRNALHHETLVLHLQPQVDLGSGQCTGAELLLRWQRANGEHVPPPLIMEMIEENGWRGMFTDWLLRYAMRVSADLAASGIEISLSLNLTAADLLDEDLPELIAQRLETWQVPAERITLELTESAMLTDRERSIEVMRRLHGLGVRLALDDFGTGYSSLSYLVALPFHEIKIDRAFVIAMFESIDSLRLVRSIIDLTCDLEMVPLAEGVETPAQRDQLMALGCKVVQGFLYARPMPLDDFVNWYRAREA